MRIHERSLCFEMDLTGLRSHVFLRHGDTTGIFHADCDEMQQPSDYSEALVQEESPQLGGEFSQPGLQHCVCEHTMNMNGCLISERFKPFSRSKEMMLQPMEKEEFSGNLL